MLLISSNLGYDFIESVLLNQRRGGEEGKREEGGEGKKRRGKETNAHRKRVELWLPIAITIVPVLTLFAVASEKV